MRLFYPVGMLLIACLFVSPAAASVDGPFEAAFRRSLLQSFDEASGKILRLADAIEEKTYGWRPMDKVNSVREILVHVATTNYALAERLGARSPVDRKTLGDTMQSKAVAIEATRRSIEFVRDAMARIPAELLMPETNVFGAKMPTVRVALLPVDHAHEHLGQLIAYARMNRIVPPWSR